MAQHTKRRTSSKQAIQGKGLQSGKIIERIKNFKGNQWSTILFCTESGTRQSYIVIFSLCPFATLWCKASQTGLIGKHEVVQTGS